MKLKSPVHAENRWALTNDTSELKLTARVSIHPHGNRTRFFYRRKASGSRAYSLFYVPLLFFPFSSLIFLFYFRYGAKSATAASRASPVFTIMLLAEVRPIHGMRTRKPLHRVQVTHQMRLSLGGEEQRYGPTCAAYQRFPAAR